MQKIHNAVKPSMLIDESEKAKNEIHFFALDHSGGSRITGVGGL
jgi:hypothetical protein